MKTPEGHRKLVKHFDVQSRWLRLAATVLLCTLTLAFAGEEGEADQGGLGVAERAALKTLTSQWKVEEDPESSQQRVVSITFSSTRLSDETMRSLGRMTDLKRLDLQFTDCDDDDLMHLSSLTNLQSIKFSPGVTGTGLFHLQKLSNLRTLVLQGRKVTDDSIAQLGLFPMLEELGLVGTAVTDPGLKHVAPLKEIRLLSLYTTRITDDAMTHIEGLPKLNALYIGATGVSDASLPRLKRMKQLKVLTLGSTKVSDVGIKELRVALPDTVVVD